MSTSLSETLNAESEEKLIDIKFAINDNKKPNSESILKQADRILEAHKQGLTTEYTDF